MITNSSYEYHKAQENYFSSSSYKFYGCLYERKHLGGATFLLKIDIDSALLSSTIPPKATNYTGPYNKQHRYIYLLAQNTEWLTHKDIERPIHVTIDSSLRKIVYESKDTTFETRLRAYQIYTDRLSKYETNETIRF